MARDSEVKNLFEQFKKAFQRLKEAIDLKLENEQEIKRDAVIQRFEFTYELLWKTLKRIASLEKIEAFSPKTAFTAGFQLGLIADEQLFVDIIEARNKTSHVYSQKAAEEIYAFVLGNVVGAFEQVSRKIKEKYAQE